MGRAVRKVRDTSKRVVKEVGRAPKNVVGFHADAIGGVADRGIGFIQDNVSRGGDLARTITSEVGQTVRSDGFGETLGVGLAGFGGAGLLGSGPLSGLLGGAQNFTNQKSDRAPASTVQGAPTERVVQVPSGGGGIDNNMLLIIGGGILAVVFIMGRGK